MLKILIITPNTNATSIVVTATVVEIDVVSTTPELVKLEIKL